MKGILQDEQDRGLALMATLDEAQRRKAVIEVSKTGNPTSGRRSRTAGAS